MDTLRILEAHISILISLERALWLTIEYNLLEFGGIDTVLCLLRCSFIGKSVLKYTLFAIDLTSLISVLLQLLQEPLDDFDEGFVIAARDLMGEDDEWTLHLLQRGDNLLGKFDLLSALHIVFKL